MALLRLEVQPTRGVSDYETTLQLEGNGYRFRAYNVRAIGGVDRWCYDLDDADGVPVCAGQPLGVGVDLLFRWQAYNVPPGALWVQRLDIKGTDPVNTEFADRAVELYYLTSDEVTA